MLLGGPIHVTLLEGVSQTVLAPLRDVLSRHEEPVELKVQPWVPFDDDFEWLAPASVQIDTYWQTALLDGVLGNHQEGTQDEDIQDALVDILSRVHQAPFALIVAYGVVYNPIFRLRAFIEPHRSINFTVPADIEEDEQRMAIETLGDAIAYATNVESELSGDGGAAGIFTVEMVFVPQAAMWMEAHFDGEELWDEDEEDSEIV